MAEIFEAVLAWGLELQNTITEALSGYISQRWIRIIAIIGAYILLRPFLVKGAEKHQMKQLAAEHDSKPINRAQAPISANAMRGFVEELSDSDSEGEPAGKGTGTAVGSGRKANKRQIKQVKGALDKEWDLYMDEDVADLLQ